MITDKTWKMLCDKLGPEWYMIKEYQRWGECPTFTNAKGELRFAEYIQDTEDTGHWELFDNIQEYDHIMRVWEPWSESDVSFKLNWLRYHLLGNA